MLLEGRRKAEYVMYGVLLDRLGYQSMEERGKDGSLTDYSIGRIERGKD